MTQAHKDTTIAFTMTLMLAGWAWMLYSLLHPLGVTLDNILIGGAFWLCFFGVPVVLAKLNHKNNAQDGETKS